MIGVLKYCYLVWFRFEEGSFGFSKGDGLYVGIFEYKVFGVFKEVIIKMEFFMKFGFWGFEFVFFKIYWFYVWLLGIVISFGVFVGV